MRPEITAYMIQASTELAKEQGFLPASANEVGCWMMNNREDIVRRAIDIQRCILDRIDKKSMKALATIIGAQVWLAANAEQVKQVIEKATR